MIATESSAAHAIKPLSRWMRLNLLVGSALPFLAGLSLFVGTSRTEDFSAWTIDSAITAATIGAGYWAGVFLTFLSGFERTWARARPALPPLLAYTLLNTISTTIELDRFHTDSDSFGTLLVTYMWLVPYALGPLLLIGLLVHQLRLPGGDPPREAPLSSRMRAVLAVQGLVRFAAGAALFVAPTDSADAFWPWELTPLTARVVASWLLAFAVGIAWVLRENDWSRSRPAAVAYTLFGALQLVVLLRYPDDVDWSRGWLYAAFLVSMLAGGAYSWWAAGRAAPSRPAPAPA